MCGSPLPNALQCQNCILPFGRTVPDNILLCKTLPFSTPTIIFFCWSNWILFNLSNGLDQSASSVSLSILSEFCIILSFLILSIFFLSPEPCSIYIIFIAKISSIAVKILWIFNLYPILYCYIFQICSSSSWGLLEDYYFSSFFR